MTLPVCPRCRRLVGDDEFAKRFPSTVWHERCWQAFMRDREWLAQHEAEGGLE